MIETTLPTSLFDQFSASHRDGTNFIAHDDEIRSILVYIGLITVILFFLFVIFSLIRKCMKMLNDETITTKKKIRTHSRRYRITSVTSRQTILSSVSSSSLLTSYHTNKSLTKPSLSSPVRTLQFQQQYSVPIMNV